MRLLIALAWLLACQALAANQKELSCVALVPLCMTQNQPFLQKGDARALYWMGRYQFIHGAICCLTKPTLGIKKPPLKAMRPHW